MNKAIAKLKGMYFKIGQWRKSKEMLYGKGVDINHLAKKPQRRSSNLMALLFDP